MARSPRTRPEELHIGVHQQRIDALLGTGRPERALAEVVPLLAEHPFHERLWGQRILGLYLGGRQAKALQTFQEIRRVLGSQLGIEPGPELVELHRRILAQDRSLDAQPAAGVIAAGADVHLPRRRFRLIGRDHDREQVRARLREHRLSTVIGPVGCGKTRLAVDVAHKALNDFTGVWFVDLSEVTDPALVADRIATTVGVVSDAGADGVASLTAFLANRTVLLMLDNCEQVVESVAAMVDVLLGAAAGLVVLATSREPLEVADEALWPLRPLALPSSRLEAELLASPAVVLFVDRLHRTVDLAGPDGPIIADICATVDGLPWGIELAAACARAFELYEIAEGLHRDPDAISGPARGNGRRLTLHEGIEWSHRLISTEEQIAHRRLSVLPRQFTLAAAAAVCGVAPLSSRQAPDLLARLVHRSLLTPIGPARRGGATRFSQLDRDKPTGSTIIKPQSAPPSHLPRLPPRPQTWC